jgi:flagellar hook-associated protein 1
MADLIGIGLSGLRAHQTALSVTGNNVSNTNTPGYSRQEAIFVDNQSILTGAGYIGQGANIATIRRNAEDFITEQVRADTTVFHERDAVLTQAESIDNLLASTTTGLTPAMSSFFQAFQGAADDPTSIPQRQLLLTQSEGLVSRFQSLDTRLNDQLSNIDNELSAAVASINSLSQSLGELNQSIAIAIGAGQGDLPNNLMDARDETLRELSEYVNVSVFSTGSDGQMNVFIGNGQPLVLGGDASILSTEPSISNSELQDITIIANGRSQTISSELSGGKIGGLLDFRDNELNSAINNLGRIALVFADTINDQHALGMDLEDNLGGQFFGDVNEASLARSRISGFGSNLEPIDHVMRVNIQDATALTSDDYEMRFEGPSGNDFTLFRAGNSESVLKGVLPGIYPANIEVEGFQIQIEAGSFKVGDRFLIKPTKSGAEDINLEVDRVESIALAAPIRADAHIGNTGNATISLGNMLDVESPLTNAQLSIFSVEGKLSPPLEIRFLTDTRFQVLDVSDPASPVPLNPPINNQQYNPGISNTLFSADPGEMRVMAMGSDAFQVPAPLPSAGALLNGFGAQDLSILSRDIDTGVVTAQTIAVAADSDAKSIADSLQTVQGIQATAYTHVRLDTFVDAANGTDLGFEINGEAITLPGGSISTQDDLARLINDNAQLQGLGIYAESDGVDVEIHAPSGIDIVVSVTGAAGDSVNVNSVDPYSAGEPTQNTQTVGAGNGVAVGGAIDVTLAEGISFTSNADTVFERAPVGFSTYMGFQFDLKGEAKAGDSFSIDYNTGGVSDNRNALALAELESQGTVQGGVISYGEAYSQIIEEIGTVTNRARLDADSAKALLVQSENNRESISGVNLDEEAGRLVQYQSAYNASAQVVSVARELFDTLLNAFR